MTDEILGDIPYNSWDGNSSPIDSFIKESWGKPQPARKDMTADELMDAMFTGQSHEYRIKKEPVIVTIARGVNNFSLCKHYYSPRDLASTKCKVNIKDGCNGYDKKCKEYCKL
jgi:hypothetical protein